MTRSSDAGSAQRSDTLRYAFVYDAIYPYVHGGAERRIYEIGRVLASEGNDVHLYGMKYWEGARTTVLDGMTLHGICRARALYTKSGRRKISQALLFGLAAIQLVFARFDVIDCSGFPYFSLPPAKLAAMVRRKPLFVTWHEVWGRKYWNQYLGRPGILGAFVELATSRMPTRIIAVSDKTARDLREKLHVRAPIQVVPNGVALLDLRQVPRALAEYDLISIGRLLKHKQVDLLIEALSVANVSRKLRLLIVGDGPERTRLEDIVAEAGLSESVQFTGFVNGDAVYGHLKSAKVLVLASNREGFGMVVLEANACGVPVVTVNSPDNAAADLIVDGINGYVSDANAPSLARAIMRAIENRDSMTPEAAVAQFDWSSVARAAEAAYRA